MTQQIRTTLPDDTIRGLDRIAAKLLCSRAAVVALAARRLIANPPARQDDLSQLGSQERRQVKARLSALELWRAERLRRGSTVVEATAATIARLARRGVTASKASLYRWERQYRRAGVAGLIDHRSTRQAAARSTVEPRSKRVRQTI